MIPVTQNITNLFIGIACDHILHTYIEAHADGNFTAHYIKQDLHIRATGNSAAEVLFKLFYEVEHASNHSQRALDYSA